MVLESCGTKRNLGSNELTDWLIQQCLLDLVVIGILREKTDSLGTGCGRECRAIGLCYVRPLSASPSLPCGSVYYRYDYYQTRLAA